MTNNASKDDVNHIATNRSHVPSPLSISYKANFSKYDAKRHEKAMRVATWKNLMASKPDDSYEDINDVQAIKNAQDFMGDYKLKTSHSYEVPDDEHFDVEGKWNQLKNLEKSIYELQEVYLIDHFINCRSST